MTDFLPTRRQFGAVFAGGLAAAMIDRRAAAGTANRARVFVPPLNANWTSGYELIELADANGLFAKHGVEIEYAVLPWDQYTVALDSGALDFAPYADYAYFINVYDKGLKAKEIVSSTLGFNPGTAGEGLIVLKDGPIQKPEDIRGKKIGTQWPTFSGVWFAADWLRRHGVSKDEYQIVPVPQAQAEQVLLQGGIDAAIVYQPIDIELARKGATRQLFCVSDIAGRFVTRGGTMASEKFIAENPDTVRGYATAIAEAAEIANNDPAAAIRLGLERGKLDPKYLPALYNREDKEDYSQLRWAPKGLHVEEDLAFWLKLVEDAGIVPAGKHKPTDFYTNEFNGLA